MPAGGARQANRGRMPWICVKQDALDDVPVYVGQPELAALVAVGELRVVDAREVHDRGLHVVHVDGFRRDVPGVVVGRSVDVPRLRTAAGQQPGKRPAKVVAALRIAGIKLAERRAAELAPQTTSVSSSGRRLPFPKME